MKVRFLDQRRPPRIGYQCAPWAGQLFGLADCSKTQYFNYTERFEIHFFNIMLGVFLYLGGLSACVPQEKYEALVQENYSLRQENSVLKAQPEEIQLPHRDLNNVDPVRQMNNQELKRLLGKLAGNVGGREGVWTIVYQNIPMAVITSPPHDRMRIVSPIPNRKVSQPLELTTLLTANFDRALDARYALYQDRLWSVYLHPLNSLTESELESALKQVANLVRTYGSTYSSSHLYFGN